VQHGLEVDLEKSAPVLGGQVQEGSRVLDLARAVDDDVQAAELGVRVIRKASAPRLPFVRPSLTPTPFRTTSTTSTRTERSPRQAIESRR